MSRREKVNHKHTLFLRKGDYAALQDMYPEVGAAHVIRSIVSKFVDENVVKVDKVNSSTEVNL